MMSFSIRPERPFPVCYPVTYHAGLRGGRGIVWNLSANGWRLSGDVPLRVGQTCPLTITVPNQEGLFVAGVTAPDTVFPEPYLLTETENKIIDDVLELLNKQGLTSRQSMKLLERLGGIIEMGQWWRRGQRTN